MIEEAAALFAMKIASSIADVIIKELLSRHDIKQGVRDEIALHGKDQELKGLEYQVRATADPAAATRLRNLGGIITPDHPAGASGGNVP